MAVLETWTHEHAPIPSAFRLRELPYPLREHVISYLQEDLYIPAVTLLYDILVSSNGASSDHRTVVVPPLQILTLIDTLIVYPPLTCRLPAHEKPEAANLALRYLSQLATVGTPRETGLAEVFSFSQDSGGRGSRKRKRSSLSVVTSPDTANDGHLVNNIANDASIFERAEDFWAVVGWALNCSVRHSRRWDRYFVWLELVLGILERDLEDCFQQSKSASTSTNVEDSQAILDKAILTSYLAESAQGRTRKRRVMRAILADGSRKSIAEFDEIWKNETKPPKQADAAIKTEKKLDVEHDEYGDYLDAVDKDEDDVGNMDSTKRANSRRGRQARKSQQGEDEDGDGNEEDHQSISDRALHNVPAIKTRQRLMGLLVRFSQIHPTGWADTEDVFDLFTEFLRPLPLSLFQHFILPSKAYLDPDMQSSLIQMILRPLLSAEAPVPNRGRVTQNILEQDLLLFTANLASMIDNAKVSILVEALMRLLWQHVGLVARPSLSKAVEDGRKARLAKVGFDGRKKSKEAMQAEQEAQVVLAESSRRMAVLLDML